MAVHAFYSDVFFQIGEHQFLAMFEVASMTPDRTRHFGSAAQGFGDVRLSRSVRESGARLWICMMSRWFGASTSSA